MTRYHTNSDGNIPFTAEEETAKDVQEAQSLSEQPMNDWKQEMARSDTALLPRWGEDILDGMDKSGVAQITLDRLKSKKDLRATKP